MTTDIWLALRDGASTVALRSDVALSADDIQAEAFRILGRTAGAAEPVFIYCDDAANFVAGLIGALSAGRQVLLPGHAAPGYLREIGAIGDRLITDHAGLDPQALIVSVSHGAARSAQHEVPLPELHSQIGFFTSGSTGAPKLCIKTLQQLALEVETHLSLWGAPEGPVAATVSQQHIYGLIFRILWPIAACRPFIAERQEMWEAVNQCVKEDSALIASPAHLSRIPEAFSLTHLPKYVFSSGGPLSPDAARDAFEKLGRYPIEMLGSTESGGVAWRVQDSTQAFWTPLPPVETKIEIDGALAVRSPFTGRADFLTMGDGASLFADGRFELHARLDRIIKVEGKRVSLPRVEEALRALTDIITDAAAVDLPDRRGALGAVVVLSPTGERLLNQLGRFRLSRALRADLADSLEPMERPRFWRFVSQIPQNPQGKRSASELRGLFHMTSPDVPTIARRVTDGDEASFEMELDADLVWFDGHFPGQPILPGVAQLHIAAKLAEETWGIHPTGREMSRIKFRHVMQPGDLVRLTLVRRGTDRLDFRYTQGVEVMASGTLSGGK